jgi:two-component system chemotaxis sensor kinase CheA
MGKNKNQKLDEEQVKNMKIINNCGNDLLFLINDILDISKIEAGELTLNLSKTDINELIEDLVSEMKPLAIEKNLVLQINNLSNNITLLSDSHRIKQILKNLISNAIKFTQTGTIEVVLEENANDITIKVIDQGIGIAEEKLKYVFERFKQADGSTTRKYGGTGLGLAISKELALLLGADIKAFSVIDKGSTFELILPKKTNIKNISDDKVTIFSKDDDYTVEDIVFFDSDLDIKEEDLTSQKNEKILVIDSDYGSFFSIAVYLKKNEFILNYCKYLNEAREILEDSKHELIIIYEENFVTQMDDFLDYCNNNNLKFIVVGSAQENEHYINKELVKTELLDKILNYLGK